MLAYFFQTFEFECNILVSCFLCFPVSSLVSVTTDMLNRFRLIIERSFLNEKADSLSPNIFEITTTWAVKF